MKIILFGAAGTIGRAVRQALSERHQVLEVGRSSGEFQADFTNPASLDALFERTGMVDAIVSAAGSAPFSALAQLTPAQMLEGLQNKLMGQVNLVLAGQRWLNDGGSFTLVSGILSHDPIRFAACVSTVNSAVEGFVRASAIELPRGLRINAVSPTVLEESMPAYAEFFRGFVPVPASRVAQAYCKSVEGLQTGQVYPAR